MNETQLSGDSSEQAQKPQILLEIGHSTRSLAEHSQMAFHDGQLYIGLELTEGSNAYKGSEFNQEGLDKYRTALKLDRPGENIHFVTGDARHIPLAPESVDTIFMANVTDSPLRVSTPIFFDQLLISVRQVLKPNGEVVVFEDRTPEVTGIIGDVKRRQLRMLGFDIAEQIDKQDPRFETMRQQYGMHRSFGRLLMDEDWRKTIAEIKLKDPDWSPRDTKAHKGDYFMVLRKSKHQPTVIPGRTPNSWDTAWKEREDEELRQAGLGDYLDDKKRLQREALEARLRAERRKELAIAVGKTVGHAALSGLKKIHKHIKAR